jgi:hypothetical protein
MFKKWRIGFFVLMAFAFALSVTSGCPARQDQTIKDSKSDHSKGDQPKDHPHKD